MCDDDEWSVFIVSMEDYYTGEQEAEPWPVFARSYEDAITLYQALLIMAAKAE